MTCNITNDKSELTVSVDSSSNEVIELNNNHVVTAEEDSRFNTQQYCKECAEGSCYTADFYLRKADELMEAGSINIAQRELLATLGHQYQAIAGTFLTLQHLAEIER